MITLKTERLLIRDPQASDLAGWHRLMSDPKTMYYIDDIMTYSMEESKENLNLAIKESNDPNRTLYFFAIENLNDGRFVGNIGYTLEKQTPVGKIVHAGYFVLPEFFGKGYTTEAFRAVIRFAFESNDVFRIKTGCYLDNKASEAIMKKCGMTKEAHFVSCAWHDGKMKDRVEYRLLKSEYFRL